MPQFRLLAGGVYSPFRRETSERRVATARNVPGTDLSTP